MNSYPLKLVTEVINKSWEKEMKKSILREQPISTKDKAKKSEYYDILHVPYIQGFTESLQKKNAKIQCRNGPQKRRHNQKGNLSPEARDPKDAAKEQSL